MTKLQNYVKFYARNQKETNKSQFLIIIFMLNRKVKSWIDKSDISKTPVNIFMIHMDCIKQT